MTVDWGAVLGILMSGSVLALLGRGLPKLLELSWRRWKAHQDEGFEERRLDQGATALNLQREQITLQVEEVVTARMAEYRLQSDVLTGALQVEVARLTAQVRELTASVLDNRRQVIAQQEQIITLSEEHARCLAELAARQEREERAGRARRQLDDAR